MAEGTIAVIGLMVVRNVAGVSTLEFGAHMHYATVPLNGHVKEQLLVTTSASAE